jgi:tRNA dimethylallyltransferase
VPVSAILVAGPTASGKSGAALALAERLCGTVINSDSMQVYRELKLLTARPAEDDMARAPHRLYGIISAAEIHSVGRWLKYVAGALVEVRKERRVPILVGGTGLYLKALTEGLAPVPEIPAEIRAHWREQADALSREALHGALAARDPTMAVRLAPADPQRIVRALEVIDATGVSLAEWQGGNAAPLLAPGETLRFLITPEREPLYDSIDGRFDRMIEQGALDEVRRLMSLKLDSGLPAMRAHGVRELGACLSGATSLKEAVAKAKTESHRYAKRQMTWARRFMSDWKRVPDAATVVNAAINALPVTR